MTDQHPENNKILHELLGRCWHETGEKRFHCRKCDAWQIVANPDYADDPRLVLEGMRKKECFFDFVLWSLREYVSLEQMSFWLDSYILDRTGRLRDLAIEFFRKEGKW